MKLRVALCFFVPLFGCATLPQSKISPNDLVLGQVAPVATAKLTRRDIIADLQLLKYALENAYAGADNLPKESFAVLLTDMDALAEKDLGPSEFCQAIDEALLKVPDNHLSARLDGQLCSPGRKAIFEEKSNVGRNHSSRSDRPWDISFKKSKRGRVPVLSILALWDSEHPAWSGFLDETKKALAKAPALIVDLRGNGGGDDTRAMQLAKLLYGQEFMHPRSIRQLQSPEARAVRLNSILLQMERARLNGKPEEPYLREEAARRRADLEESIKGNQERYKLYQKEEGPPFDPKKGFAKPIMVLIDRECGSSCESLLEALENHPFVKTVGANTGGFVHFGETGKLRLPHLGVLIQMGTKFFSYPDGRFVEKTGYSPKVRVADGKNALDEALALIDE